MPLILTFLLDPLTKRGKIDYEKAYHNWYSRFKEPSVIINQHYVPGITSETVKLFGKTGTGSSDSYIKDLIKTIEAESVNQKLKDSTNK